MLGEWLRPTSDIATWRWQARRAGGSMGGGGGGGGNNLTAAELRACYRNRTVYSLGNSIARQFAFELPTYLFGEAVPARGTQKNLCSKSGGAAPELCAVISADGTVTARDAWFLYLDGVPTLPGGTRWPGWRAPAHRCRRLGD